MKNTTPNFLQQIKIAASSAAIMLLMSCQPGAPIVKVLGEVGGFQLTESVMTLKTKDSKDVFYVTGKCFGSVSAIQVSFDGGATFEPLSQHATSASMNCSTNGTYTYTIDPNITSMFDIPFNSSYRDFKFRAASDFGMSSIQTLRRQVKLGDFQITAGSGSNTSVSGTLSGRIIPAAAVVSGPTFVLKGAVRIK